MEVIELKIWGDSGSKSQRSGRDCTLSEQGLGQRLAAGEGGGVVGDSVVPETGFTEVAKRVGITNAVRTRTSRTRSG
jgi:hypothetical protein